jgi:DNA-binding NarL/FixJ family response regulator
MSKINLLIVEDHHYIAEAYKGIVNDFKSPDNFEFNVISVKNCKAAYNAIVGAEEPFDLAFLDLNLPTYEEKGLMSGKDLAFFMQKHSPNCKLMILTMESDIEKIVEILDEINPLGLAIKNDLGYKELMLGMGKVIRNLYYYSISVIKIVAIKNHDIYNFDQYDREIIKQLTLGVDPKNLDQFTPLTSEETEKRRAHIFWSMNVDPSNINLLRSRAIKQDLLEESE